MVRAIGTPTKLTKAEAKQLLANVPEEKIFWSHDGQAFRNLKELSNGLTSMSDETYSYHANNSKNDFANWVREVIGGEDISRDLGKTMRRIDAAKILEARVRYLGSLR